jgi:histidine triad (HIT) family protein
MASIFTRILNKELPGYFLLEDEHTFAILTLDGIHLGHTIVIPKKETDYFVDVPEPQYSRVYQNAQKLAKAIQKATGCKRVGQAVIGLEVPHFHLHLIPMWSAADLDFSKAKRYPADEMKDMQQKIVKYLG